MIKALKMRWVGYVVRMEREGVHTWFWWENLKGRGHVERPDIDGIFKK
jgi:hypothetical protein